MKLLAMLMIALCCSCGGASNVDLVVRDATVSANSTANTIEVMQSLALIVYRTEQELQVAGAKDKADAQARVKVVRAMWVSIWDAFKAARAVYSNLVLVLNAKPLNTAAVQTEVNALQQRVTELSALLATARSRAGLVQ